MTSWAENRQEYERLEPYAFCLACGNPLPESLFRLGSLRCSACRCSNERLDENLVERWLAHGAPLH